MEVETGNPNLIISSFPPANRNIDETPNSMIFHLSIALIASICDDSGTNEASTMAAVDHNILSGFMSLSQHKTQLIFR